MAQGRGSAGAYIAVVAMLCVVNFHVANSAVFTVGDGGGWTFSSGSWTSGKRFRAGDVLVFNYNSAVHNMVPVSAAGYKRCAAPSSANVLSSGNDRVTLSKGTNYFICSYAATPVTARLG
ncbi:chemocyanin precursor [Iris pallida]|uniref:Plantacyanin n=1 Tax=Iris pallida TaxID=29817 RepID=A0AAX6GIE4_IRIPA|nr:chemocyanin precursor [Iris pallida]